MQAKRGFTLIELLVAIAIFATVSVMAYQSLHSFVDSREKLQTKSTRLADLQIAYVIMAQDLEQLVARPVKDEYLQQRASFLAIPVTRGQFLEFSRTGYPNPGGLPRSHLIRVAYEFEEGVLSRTVWQQLDRSGGTVEHKSPFISGIESLEVRYLKQQQPRPVWILRWPQADWEPANFNNEGIQILPTAVEVTMTLEDLGEIKWVFASEG
jgi:general secretion pathway protein J